MTHGSLSEEVSVHGYAVIRHLRPTTRADEALASLGRITLVSGLAEVQVLSPKERDEAPPNTYSGNFGLGRFPYHTDLSHWHLPPRFLVLRCIRGSHSVSTQLLDGRRLIASRGADVLRRTLVKPRRPRKGRRPLLPLLQSTEPLLLRWDELFVQPASVRSQAACELVRATLQSLKGSFITLTDPGDTIVVDNWRMLHARSRVPPGSHHRRIARAYFSELYEHAP